MASKARRARRAPSKTMRDPGLPGPTPEQLADAVRATKKHQVAPGWDASGLESFHAWLAALDDPFADAYLEGFPNPDITGENPIQPGYGDTQKVLELAYDAAARFTARQEACLRDLIAAVENVDPAPLTSEIQPGCGI